MKKFFGFQDLISIQKELYLYKTKNTDKNNELVNVIKSGLRDLEKDIEEMGNDVEEIDKPDEIVDIVGKNIINNIKKDKN